METKRVKGDCGGTVDNDCCIMLEDRISQLPDPLIHHIFSFLPTIYLVRMSVVSKRWRHMWVSTPFLYFEDFYNITFNKKVRNRDMVLKFVTNCLRYHELGMHIPDTFLISFRFETSYLFANNSSAVRRIDDWLNFVVKNKVKELDLKVKQYHLPHFVLNASSLTHLKLREMKLVAPSPPTFPSLKVLSLMGVESDAKSLQNLISGCPVIDELHLSGFDLGHLDFTTVSGTLRELSLLFVDLNDQWLGCLISRLPLLERLTINGYAYNNISVNSHSLKYFSIDSRAIIETALRTPNLVCLHYACYSWSNISVEAPNLLEANLSLHDRGMDKTSYMDLVNLLSNLHLLKKMTLSVWGEEILIFPKRIRKKFPSPLPNLKHVKLKIFSNRWAKTAELQDSLHWCAPSVQTIKIGKTEILISY